jgi:predicted PurR-regulated permease PerM
MHQAEENGRGTGKLPLRAQGIARTALVVGLILLGLWTVRAFLPALAWAAVLGVALWPLYRRAEQYGPVGRHNILMPALFTLAVGLTVLAPLVLVVLEGARETHDILQWIREIETSGVPLPDWVSHLPFGDQAAAWWRDNLERAQGLSDLRKRVEHGSMLLLTREFGTALVRRLVLFAFTLMALFFVFRDGRAIRRELLVAGHRLFGPRGERIARHMVASVHGTVNGLVLVGLGEGALLGIAYWLAGVPHPVLLASLTGVAAMIPFGAPLVFGIAALLLLAQGAAASAITIVAFGLAVVGVADHVVRPVLIGGATKLPFLWVLLGILGGVETWGLLGLFLGPALMAALMLLWRELTSDHDLHTDALLPTTPSAVDQ